ncbi:MAG: hypothetical protein E7Y34_02280, partial [Mycoplasma sp.]|nr:hypothetical protein [Mycoplasma sp.]
MISTKNIDLTSSSSLLKQDAKLKQHAIKKEFKEQLKFNKFAIYQDLNALIVVKHSLRSKRNFLINQLRTKYKLAYTKIKSYFDPNTIYKSHIAFIKNEYQEKIEYALHNEKAKEANILKIELQEKLNSLEKQNDLIELFDQKKKALNDWYIAQKKLLFKNYIAEKISVKKQINELKIITKEKWFDKKNKLINEYKTKLEVAKQQLLNNINKHKLEVKKLKESNHFINNYGDRIEYTKIVKIKSCYFKSIKSIYNNLIILKTINDELQMKSKDIENSYKFFNDQILLNIDSIEQKTIKNWND